VGFIERKRKEAWGSCLRTRSRRPPFGKFRARRSFPTWCTLLGEMLWVLNYMRTLGNYLRTLGSYRDKDRVLVLSRIMFGQRGLKCGRKTGGRNNLGYGAKDLGLRRQQREGPERAL
jgi:hypothetical protein